MSTKIRLLPNSELLLWRTNFLANLRNTIPVRPNDFSKITLSPGNRKTGNSGKLYKKIFVWNLPAVVTCPNASPWCLQHCYNADNRADIFPVNDWVQNWWMVINEPEYLKNTILKQLTITEKPHAVRLHSSGDFYSKKYINFWFDIIAIAKNTIFWCYTRSWAENDLLPYLEKIRKLPNIQIFASWDLSMSIEPPGNNWRCAYVYTDPSIAISFCKNTKTTIICPEQVNKIQNCASCGFCMKPIKKNILFYFH